MRVILTDRSVIASGLVALAVVAALGLAPRWARRAELVAGAGLVVGYLVRDPHLDRYLRLTERADRWMIPVVATAVLAVAGAASWVGARTSGPSSSLTVAICMAGLGVFLCVPETDVLRFVAPPLAVTGAAVALGALRPLNPLVVVVLAAGLGWLAIVDGHTRGSAVVGGAACLAAVALVPLIGSEVRAVPPPDAGQRVAGVEPWLLWQQAIIGAAVLLCSRVAGLQSSTTVAVVLAVIVLLAAAVALQRSSPAAPVVP